MTAVAKQRIGSVCQAAHGMVPHEQEKARPRRLLLRFPPGLQRWPFRGCVGGDQFGEDGAQLREALYLVCCRIQELEERVPVPEPPASAAMAVAALRGEAP